MRYDWDRNKDRVNQQRHGGISFQLAALVFEDPRCLIYPDRVDDQTGERRWHAIGAAQIKPGTAALLLVVHMYREENDEEEEIIRIVSARPADKREIRRYRKQGLD